MIASRHIRRQVTDPSLRTTVTPTFPIGCKRILISNDWYPALQKPNVEVLSSGIKEITATSIIGKDGSERQVDCIIFGTGFYATDNPIAAMIHGRDGRVLADVWANGEEAYLGSSVHGFPNFFFIVGPNVTLGHSSMVYMIETQIAAISRVLTATNDLAADAVEVRAEVQQAYNKELQNRLGGSVWATGCDSWYKHRSGKITQLWPGFTFSFRRRNRDFKQADYTFSKARVEVTI